MSTEQKAESIADNYVKVLRYLKERYPQIIKEIGLGINPNPASDTDDAGTLRTSKNDHRDKINF